MRSLLLLLLFISSPVYAIVVTGEGFSFEDAKQQAFKQVIEKEVGVIVDSERIVVEKDLVSSKILTYSAGFITSYNVLEHTPMGEMHYVKLDVTVASSKLKDFILLQPFDILDYDGSQIKEMIDSFKQQAIDADTLVNNFLKYYPHEAYLVTTNEYVVKTDPYRNAYIEIPYQIKWNPKDSTYTMYNYVKRTVGELDDIIEKADEKDAVFNFDLEDLTPVIYIAETLNLGELIHFIDKEIEVFIKNK